VAYYFSATLYVRSLGSNNADRLTHTLPHGMLILQELVAWSSITVGMLNPALHFDNKTDSLRYN